MEIRRALFFFLIEPAKLFGLCRTEGFFNPGSLETHYKLLGK